VYNVYRPTFTVVYHTISADDYVLMCYFQERRRTVPQRERGGFGLSETVRGHRTSRTVGLHPIRIGPEYGYPRTRRFQR